MIIETILFLAFVLAVSAAIAKSINGDKTFCTGLTSSDQMTAKPGPLSFANSRACGSGS
jgi:hypothetical protein